MGKVITSPVERFAGNVTIPDFLTIPQAQAWENAQAEALELKARGDASNLDFIAAWQPGLCATVEQWSLSGFSHDPFQTTPRVAVINLVAWLIGEISKLYEDAADVPNG